MEALLGIPKVLSNIEDVRSNKDIQTIFKEYKRNVQIFIDNMKEQVSNLIDGYERKIASLKAQNSQLKSSISNLPSKQFIKTGTSAFSPSKNSTKQFSSIAQYNKGGQLEKMQTAKSKIFTPAKVYDQEEQGLSPLLRRVQMQSDQIGFDNPEGQFFDKSVSKFQQKSKRKKQRQEQLRLFLQSGKKSLNYTTQRFLDAVGKSSKYASNNQEDQLQQRQYQQDKNQNDSFLNKSLGNICNNLDNSFISKKARSEKKKKMQRLENQLERKKKQEIMLNQMMKKKGVTNLLQRLRDNAEVTSKNQKQIITVSRLISCGQKEDEQINKIPRKNSKVMINPIPIDIEKKFKATRNNSISMSPTSPEKKPQSILKQSTILSKSITGISAIQFKI